MRVANEPIVINGDMSGNVTSDAVYLDQMLGFAIQAIITGSPVGTFKLQASVDPGINNPSETGSAIGVTHWTDIANSVQAVNGAGQVVWNGEATFYKWVRLVYTRTSGSGTLNANYNVKGL